MPETEVRCTCADFEVNAGCAAHGVAMTATAIAERQRRREMSQGAELIRRRAQAWMEIPKFRAVVMEVVREDVKRRGPGPIVIGADPASGPDQSVRLSGIRGLNGMLIIDEITPVLSDEVWGATRSDCRCEHCGWEGDAKALYLPAGKTRPEDCACPICVDGGQIVDLEYEDDPSNQMAAVIGTFRTPPAPKAVGMCDACSRIVPSNSLRRHAGGAVCDPCFSKTIAAPAPAAACTAHATAADLGSGEGAFQTSTPSPLDAAIRGSASLDPGGDRKPAEQLLVETPEQKEARYKADAERIERVMREGVR